MTGPGNGRESLPPFFEHRWHARARRDPIAIGRMRPALRVHHETRGLGRSFHSVSNARVVPPLIEHGQGVAFEVAAPGAGFHGRDRLDGRHRLSRAAPALDVSAVTPAPRALWYRRSGPRRCHTPRQDQSRHDGRPNLEVQSHADAARNSPPRGRWVKEWFWVPLCAFLMRRAMRHPAGVVPWTAPGNACEGPPTHRRSLGMITAFGVTAGISTAFGQRPLI